MGIIFEANVHFCQEPFKFFFKCFTVSRAIFHFGCFSKKKIIENAHIVKSDTLLFRKSTKLFSFYKITVYTYTLKQKYKSVIKRSKKKNGIIERPNNSC